MPIAERMSVEGLITMVGKIAKYVSAFLMLAAAALPCETLAQGSSRTVRIAAVNSEGGRVTSVDLAVSAGADAITLYAVHGAADHGADMNAWDSIDSVATVPASESEEIFNYPVSSPHDAFYRFMLASFTPPFKKQLAFLKSSGSQYFILGDKCPNQDWRVVADVSFTLGSTVGFWGARKAAYNSAFLCLCQGGTTLRFDMAGGIATYDGTDKRRYQIDQTNQNVPLVWDGGSDTVNVSKDAFTSPCPMGLFAVNSDGSPTSLSRGKMTLYSFRVWTNRTDAASLIYDLIPCVKNDDTVTLYNRVDGSFLSPEGTFTYNEADVVSPTVGDLTIVDCSDLLPADKQIVSSSISRPNDVLTGRVIVTTGFETNTVIVAYGSADGGDNPARWENCAILGSVAFDATSFSAVVPFEWSDSVRYARFFTVPQSDSLGDMVLKSSGTQYIVTDYTATSNTMVEARVAFIDTMSEVAALWTGRESSSSQSFGMILHKESSWPSSQLRVDFGGKVTYVVKSGISAGNTLHTVAMRDGQFVYDSTTDSFDTTTKRLTVAGAPLTFFAMNTSGTITYTSRVAFAEVKIWSDYADETSLVLHLKPAVEDGRCGFRNILEGGRFYPNSAEGGDDFEVLYPNLNVLSVSDVMSDSGSGLTIFVR